MGGRGGSSSRGGGNAGGGGALPELTGTERQVAWANQIRGDFMDKTGLAAVDDESRRILRNGAAKHADAKWWIDNRNGGAVWTIFNEYVRGRIDGRNDSSQSILGRETPVIASRGDRKVSIADVSSGTYAFRVDYGGYKDPVSVKKFTNAKDAADSALSYLRGGDAPEPPEWMRRNRERRVGRSRFRARRRDS